MREINKKIIAAAVLFSVLLSMTANITFANAANTVCSVTDNVYSISGSGGPDYINVIIMPADESASSVTSEKLSDSRHISFSVKNSGSGFEKSFKLPEDFPAGEYKSVVWDGAECEEYHFIYGDEAFSNNIIHNKINDGLLDEVIEWYGGEYGIDKAAYIGYSDTVRKAIADILAGEAITDFAKQYKDSCIKALFDNINEAVDVYTVLSLVGTDFTYYNKLNSHEQSTALSKLLKNLPGEVSGIKAAAEKCFKDAYNSRDKSSAQGGGGSSASPGAGPSAGTALVKNYGAPKTGQTGESNTVTSFSDISKHWAEETINNLLGKGMISGGGDGKFYPDNRITRAEFSKMIVNCLGLKESAASSEQFTDVGRSDWFYGCVMTLYGREFISGYDDGTFRPNENITREEMSVIIYRVLSAYGAKLEGEADFDDKSGISDYAAEAVAGLSNAGILTGSDNLFRPKDNLTRAEAAAVILRVYNSVNGNSETDGADKASLVNVKTTSKQDALAAEAEKLVEKLIGREMRGVSRAGFISDIYDIAVGAVNTAKDQYFDDLPVSREETGSVQAAYDLGYVLADKNFMPDETISLNDAVRAVVCALGYKQYAEAAGGGAAGYDSAARRAEILDGIPYGSDKLDEVTAKILILNMLNSRIVTLNGSNEFVADADTLLMSRYGIQKTSGIVNATMINSLTQAGIEKRPTVTIGSEVFSTAEDDTDDYSDYIGFSVNAYYNDDGELIAAAKTEKNETVSFPAAEAEFQDNYTISYWDDGRRSTLRYKLDEDYYFMYNGALSDRIPNAVLASLNDGIVELLDNDNDRRYEIVTIKHPTYIVVKGTSKENKLVYDKYSSDSVLDLSNDDIILHIAGRDGEAIRFLDISEGQTYECFISEDGELVELSLVPGVVSGKVNTFSEDEIEIDGTKYKLTEYFRQNYAGTVKIGKDYSFVIASDNKIIGYLQSANDMKVGYLSYAGWEDGAEGDSILVRIFTADSEFVTYTIKDKVNADGSSVSVSNLYNRLVAGENVIGQLLGYSADENGVIRSLDFAEVNKSESIGAEKKEGNSLTEYEFDTQGVSDAFYFKENVNLIYPFYTVSGTTVFVIPKDISKKEDYKISNYSIFADGTKYPNLKVYNLSEEGTAEYVVYRADSIKPNITKYAGSFVVERVTETVDDEDNIVSQIYGWSDNKYASYYIDKDVSTLKASGEQIGFGDIIRFSASSDGVIETMICDFDANENVFGRNNISEAGYFNAGNRDVVYQLGKAYSVSNGYIYLGGNKNDLDDMTVSRLQNFTLNSGKIAVINMRDKTVRPAAASDIRTYKNSGEGDIVLLRQMNLSTMSTFVYVW